MSLESYRVVSGVSYEPNDWRGFKWELVYPLKRVQIWKPSTTEFSEEDEKTLEWLAVAAPQIMQMISSCMTLTDAVVVDIAVFPSTAFFEAVRHDSKGVLRLSDGQQCWVTSCIREGALCVRKGFLLETPVEQLSSLALMLWVHEFGHLIFGRMTGSERWNPSTPGRLPRTIREGLCEALGLCVLQMLRSLEETKAFLGQIKASDFVSRSELDERGFFTRSTAKPVNNISYMSAALYVAGLVGMIGRGEWPEGIAKLIEVATSNEAGIPGYYTALSKATGIPEDQITDGRELQTLGLGWIQSMIGLIDPRQLPTASIEL